MRQSSLTQHDFTVISNTQVAEGVWRMVFASEVVRSIEPGQFMYFEVPGDGSHILRIPLSFSLADAAFVFNTDGRRGEQEALQSRTCDWIYAWEDFPANQPLIARGATPFGPLNEEELRKISRHWVSSRSQQMNMFDLL